MWARIGLRLICQLWCTSAYSAGMPRFLVLELSGTTILNSVGREPLRNDDRLVLKLLEAVWS